MPDNIVWVNRILSVEIQSALEIMHGVRCARAGEGYTLSSELGTYKTVKARFWSGPSRKGLWRIQVVSSSLGSGENAA